jgi:hypothetical protein
VRQRRAHRNDCKTASGQKHVFGHHFILRIDRREDTTSRENYKGFEQGIGALCTTSTKKGAAETIGGLPF